jgi:hypothetical protein
MTWDTFNRRGEVLRNVIAEADARRDGVLPMELPGVAEAFGDELTLLGALQLRWHTHLAGAVERELMEDPADLEDAVTRAWRAAAGDLAGVRRILDTSATEPHTPEAATMLDRGRRKDWTLLAAMAGKASPSDDRAAEVGRAIEERARAAYRPTRGGARRAAAPARPSMIDRLKAHLAA